MSTTKVGPISTLEINGNDVEVLGENKDWEQAQTDQRLFVPMTVEEWEDTKGLSTLDGEQRIPAWTHVTAVKTINAAYNMLSYHLSEMPVATKSPQQWIVLMIHFSVINICTAMEKGVARMFNRAGIDVQLQLKYNLLATEVSKSFVLRVSKPLSDPLTTFTWQAGYVWSFNLPIHVSDLEDKFIWFARQSLQYAGTKMLLHLPTQHLEKTLTMADEHQLKVSNGVKTIERLRGSTSLWKWIEDGMGESTKILNTSRVNWLEEQAKPSNEKEGHNDEDTEMEGSTKRIKTKWVNKTSKATRVAPSAVAQLTLNNKPRVSFFL